MPLKRKKWTEEEERSLIDKYADMQSDGSLSRMRTREKKFLPIAEHVNAAHHAVDPLTYPFLWSWKDASTKVQNMRHQYLLVKQKLISAVQSPSDGGDPLNWSDGLSLWPNFLRYKQVFGDAPLPPKPPDPTAATDSFIDGDLGLGLGFEEVDEEGFDYEEVGPAEPADPLPAPPERKRRRRKTERRALALIAAELERMREREEEAGEEERERRRRREEEEEKEWEERMERRREEWRKRIEGMMSQHRAHMDQIYARVLNEQQAVIGQLLGIVSHWAGGGGGMFDGSHLPYVAQMHGIVVPGENRVGADGQEDQFIVDG